MASAEPGTPRYARLGVLIAALAAVFAGLIGLGTIGYWYAADMGWTGSGSTIVESRSPIIAAALVPAASLLFGLVTLLVKDDVPARSSRGAVLFVANLFVGAAVWFGVHAYPQVQPAKLIAIGGDGRVTWQAEIPVTEVFGLRDETATTITVEGRADRRRCRWQIRSVEINRSTGEILDVETLPTFYEGPSQVPPEPTPLRPGRNGFDVEQGSAPFVCRS